MRAAGSGADSAPSAAEDWLKVLDRHFVQVAALDVVDDAVLLDLLKADERWEMVCGSEDIVILTRRLLDWTAPRGSSFAR